MKEDTLKNKTVKGVGWSAADALLGQGVTFMVGIVLARLLSPSEYGVIGICLIFNTVLNSIVDSGFSNSLIRKTNVNNDDYNTMFFTNLLVSIVLYLILFFLSPYISSFFRIHELISLIRVTGLILIINALSIVQVTILTKRIDFKTKTKASLFSAIISGFIGILMAILNFGIWALAMQLLLKQILYTTSLWIFNKWIPQLNFSKTSFKYMWGFGSKIMLSGLLNNIWNQLNQVVVGKFYNPYTLGQFTRSSQYASIFSENITAIVQRVSYPILAEIQDDKIRMLTVYRKIIKTTMFITCICMFFIAAVSEPLIYCLIGDKWHEAAIYLPLICINMSLYPLHAINLNMLQINGRSDIMLVLEIIKKIISVAPILVGIFIGVYWMLVVNIGTGLISYFLNSWYTGKKMGYSSINQLLDVTPYYGIAIFIAISVYFFKFLLLDNWIILLIQITVCVSILFILNSIIGIPELKQLIEILYNTLTKHKKL
ncbi:lipopolysaccharide biosynthesis protein [Segatella bryantii]|uniref:lipopolysaccharide biosynthesis protein n=1 Tax=Segatella bryantii TaxID=77095 RepID=UPI00241E0AAC|nr:lipopolysaccharide biosynthesis protein [Segatella bryantii]